MSNEDILPTSKNTFIVLCAEDNVINQEMMSETFEFIDGATLTIVENGAEAIDCLDKQAFDLILMDINMPIMNGSDAILEIRRSGKNYQCTPIIVLTANAVGDQPKKYLDLGANAFVAKPIDITALINLVESYRPN